MAPKDDEKDIVIKPMYMKYHYVMLGILGINLFPLKGKFIKLLSYCYSTVWLSVFIIHTAAEGGSCIVGFANNTEMYPMTFRLAYFISHFLGMIKLFLVIYLKDTLWELGLKMEGGMFKPNYERGGIEEFRLVKNAIEQSNVQATISKVLVVTIVFNRLVSIKSEFTIEELYSPVSNMSSFFEQRVTPFDTYFPFNQYKTPVYEIVLLFQCVVTIGHGFYIGAIDAIICGFMMQFRAQFLIIKNTLTGVIDRAERMVIEECGKLDESVDEHVRWHLKDVVPPRQISPKTQVYCEKFIKECVLHHQELMTLCDEAENLFSNLMLSQFISSVLLLCFSLFYLSLTPPLSIKFISMTCYLVLMMFQILTICWWGNEVLIISGELINFTYNDIDWVITNENIKRCLLLMMMRSQRPFSFTAGKFVFLSLETFMSIVRGSASYFTFLSSMD